MKNRPLIAVVEDDQSVREALENLISSVGGEVKLFASAEAFLDSDAPLQTDCGTSPVGRNRLGSKAEGGRSSCHVKSEKQ